MRLASFTCVGKQSFEGKLMGQALPVGQEGGLYHSVLHTSKCMSMPGTQSGAV